MKLIRLVKLVLYPDRYLPSSTEPHVFGHGSMLIQAIEPGAVNGILRSPVVITGTGRSGCYCFNRQGKRLNSKKLDIAFHDAVIRCSANRVDAPVVFLAELEQSVGIKRIGILILTDQHAQGIGTVSDADILEHGSKVHIIGVCHFV